MDESSTLDTYQKTRKHIAKLLGHMDASSTDSHAAASAIAAFHETSGERKREVISALHSQEARTLISQAVHEGVVSALKEQGRQQ